jgi:FkbM family methyltransferase
MPFITYAQNFEDLMLHRALRNIEGGFYIDVGANDPEYESVTKAFYDRGWCGVNIEPTDTMFARLNERRSRDINLNAAAWTSTGKQVLYFITGSEAWATLEPGMAELHREAGRKVEETTIQTVSLRDVCEKYVGEREIHFMKIDVEGGELKVLHGHDFTKWRPWIILGEAHGPDITLEYYRPWQTILEHANYKFVYTDGLNRFFIAKERVDQLSAAFVAPPNVYDEWIRWSELHTRERAELAERDREEAWAALAEAQRQLKELRGEAEALRAKVAQSQRPERWRIASIMDAILARTRG